MVRRLSAPKPVAKTTARFAGSRRRRHGRIRGVGRRAAEERRLRQLALVLEVVERGRARQQRLDVRGVLRLVSIRRARVEIAVRVLVARQEQSQVQGRAARHAALEDRVAGGGERIGSRHRRGRRHRFPGGLQRPVRRHRDVAALRVARDQQLAAVRRIRRIRGRERAPRRRQRIDHVLRLLVAVEVGVVTERRGVVTHVVRRDDDVAFRREHGGDQDRLRVVRGLEVGEVVGLVRVRAVGIQHDRTIALAAAARIVGHHQGAGRRRELARRVHRPVLKVIDVDAAFRRQDCVEDLLGHRPRADECEKFAGRVGGHQRHVADQVPTMRRRRGIRWPSHVAIAVVAGSEQRCEHKRQDSKSMESGHRGIRNRPM